MKHTKHLFLLLLLPLFMMMAMPASAQSKSKFKVVSFEESPFDLSAREKPTSRDDGTGYLYAIVKVTSTNPDDDLSAYNFDFGYLQHVVESKDGELWLYVQQGAKAVTITREGYNPVRRYSLSTTIQPGKVYVMQLSSQRQSAKLQMVRFNISPANAKAMVMCQKELSDEDEMVFGYADESGSVARNLEIGTYTYKIISDTYHTSEGRFVLDAKKNMHIEHVTLRPNFANVTFKVSDGVDVYINEEKKSTGEWSGVLKAGTHRVGGKKKKHSTVYIDVEVKAGMDTVINLPDPKPVVGTLAIVSSPLDAKILIDGQDYGHTPRNIDGLLIGNHTLEIIKEGYLNEIREIEIIEDEITDCNVSLAKGSSTKTQTAVVARNALNDNVPVIYDSNGIRRSQRTKTVKGVVIDKNGYPVVGATVQASSGNVNTTVANDGTFSMEVPEWLKTITVEKPGYIRNKKKVDDDMLFRMKKYAWFVNAVVSSMVSGDRQVSWDNEISSGTMRYGIMFGQTGNWGWYSKILFGYEHNMDPAITVGFTKRLSSKFQMYAGAGYASVESHDLSSGEDFYHYDCYRHDAIMLDLGFMIKPTEHFNINIGCSGYQPFNESGYDADPCLDVHIGLGYSF